MIKKILPIIIILAIPGCSQNYEYSYCDEYCIDQEYEAGNCQSCGSPEVTGYNDPVCSNDDFFNNPETKRICGSTGIEDDTIYGCLCKK